MDVPKRRRKGSAITEFGPALFLFVIIIFFPMLDFLGLLAAYCAGWYCNFAVCREAAVRKQAEAVQVITEVNGNLGSSGIVKFIGITNLDNSNESQGFSPPTATMAHNIDYETPGNGQQPIVKVTTFVSAMPFIQIPWWSQVPGMNAPMPFTIQSNRPREVTQ